jgi:hypothetical protein
MRMPSAFLACVCLLGTMQPARSQTKAAAIPGYLNPATGEFTTHVASSATPTPQVSLTGTSVFFREDFPITITNYDQPANAQVVCSVSMLTVADANGLFSDGASVAATSSGGGWTCDVPVLTLWTLKTPATDTITGSVTVAIYTQTSAAGLAITRESSQSFSLTVPANTATVENYYTFQL